MGKGDKRSAKGKRFRASYGNTRPNPSKVRKARKEKKAARTEEA